LPPVKLTPRVALTTVRRRVRPHVAAVFQTAAAAVAAWWLALLLLPAERPAFASIAAIIVLGTTYGRRRRNAFELLGGVLLGITVASALVFLLGSGPWQIALLVILAMTAALVFRGGELLVNEAAISAILIASFEPTTSGFSADRILEGLIGGGVGLAVASFLLPPDPVGMVGQVAQTLFGKLGRTLEHTAAALDGADPRHAERSLQAARGMDDDVDQLEETLSVAAETARFSPARRGGLAHVQRYERTMPQLDFAVRNTRVLARYAARQVRLGEPAPQLAAAVRELASAVWLLAAQYEHPDRIVDVRHAALAAARMAEEIHDREPALLTTQIVGQIRTVAVDVVRAAEAVAEAGEAPAWDLPTEELLAA